MLSGILAYTVRRSARNDTNQLSQNSQKKTSLTHLKNH